MPNVSNNLTAIQFFSFNTEIKRYSVPILSLPSCLASWVLISNIRLTRGVKSLVATSGLPPIPIISLILSKMSSSVIPHASRAFWATEFLA